MAFPRSFGIYLGDEMETGVGHYAVILHSEDLTLDDGFYFHGTSDAVWLEMYAKLSADPRNGVQDPGTYKPVATEEDAAEFTFVTAEGNMPSSLVACVDGEDMDDLLPDGEVVVEQKGGGYLITMTVKSESGAEKFYKYEGKISFFPMFPYGPDPFEGTFVRAQANYFGNYYETGIGNFEFSLIDIADEEAMMGHMLYLDFNMLKFDSQSAITILPGIYTCDKTGSATTISTFNAGSDDGKQYYDSLWVETDSHGAENVLMVTDGTCTITKTGT